MRRAGGKTAASIALVWVLLGSTSVLVELLGGNVLYLVFYLGVCTPAIAIAFLLGRAFTGRLVRGRLVAIPMAVAAVVANAAVIAALLGGVSAFVILARELRVDTLVAVGSAITAFAGLTIVYFVFGLILFGLPGLAVALSSAYIWKVLMTRAPKHKSASDVPNVVPAVKRVTRNS